MPAEWTTSANSKPKVSTRMCRLRPLIRLPASSPRGPPISVVFTVWLSMMAASGLLSGRPCAGPWSAGRSGSPPTCHRDAIADSSNGPFPMGESRGAASATGCRRDEIEDGVEGFAGRRTAAALPVWAWESGAGPASTGHRSDRWGILRSLIPFSTPKTRGRPFSFSHRL